MKFFSRVAACVLGILTVGADGRAAHAMAKTARFESGRQTGSIDRVTVQLDVAGEKKEPEIRPKGQSKPQPTAIGVACTLQYDEKIVAWTDKQRVAIRHYEKAEATLKIGSQELKPSLRADRNPIVSQLNLPETVLFSPRGPLSLEELEVVDILGNTVVLDSLLPDKPVAVADDWAIGDDVLAALLGIDKIKENEVRATLKEVTDTVARFELAGKLSGTKNDVATKIQLRARYRFDLRTKRIDWLGMVANEQHDAGMVEAGFDVSIRLQVRVAPQVAAPALTEEALAGLRLEADPALTRLAFASPDKKWQIEHDRRWHAIPDPSGMAVVHLIDGGEQVAQCIVSCLDPRPPEKLPTLAQFQGEIRTALDKSFGEFVSASEGPIGPDYRLFRVDIAGKAEDVPMQWHYYMIADKTGRSAVFAVTVQAKLAERLGKRDAALVEGFRFLDAAEDAEK